MVQKTRLAGMVAAVSWSNGPPEEISLLVFLQELKAVTVPGTISCYFNNPCSRDRERDRKKDREREGGRSVRFLKIVVFLYFLFY